MEVSDVKWIKITTDVFDSWKIKHIKAVPELGHTLVCVWFELLCMAGSCNEHGLLVMSNNFVATDELIAEAFHEDIKIVQMALRMFEEMGMIEVTENNAIQIANWNEYQSKEGLEAIKEYEKEKKAKYREKQKQLQLEDKKCPRTMSMDKSTDSSLSISIYSYSNNDNINNLIYYIDNIYEDRCYLEKNPDLYNSISDWMRYKDSRKPKSSNHYEEIGIKKFLNKCTNLATKHGVSAVCKCIDEAISNNYQGVVWNRVEEFSEKTNLFEGLYEKAEEQFDYVYKIYPNKGNYDSAKREWIKRIDGSEKKAGFLYGAVRMFVKDHDENNQDKLIPYFEKWLREESEYWVKQYKNERNGGVTND